MFSTSPPAACQEKTSPPEVQCQNSPLGTLGPACWSRLVMHTGTDHAAQSVYCFLTWVSLVYSRKIQGYKLRFHTASADV